MQLLQPSDPRWIGRFRLVGRLGAGGMGRVYLGRTPEGRQAAVKVIRDEFAADTSFRHRFRREVSAALSVAGLFTARVLDADPESDPPWLATEFIDGPSLRDRVQRTGPLPPAELSALASGLADAVGAIHAAGLVHRDLKPANVLLSPDGPKVIDFGIAWSAEGTQLTGTGHVLGTPEYMAPEQITGSGQGGPAIDVFAYGATVAFAATGRSVFAADQTAAVLYRITQLEPDLKRLPDELRELVRGCLDKDPARRPTAQQLSLALRGEGETVPVGRAAVTRPPPARTPGSTDSSADGPRSATRTRSVLATAIALLVVATVTLIGLALANRAESSAPPAAAPPAVTAQIDPASPEALFIDRFCASGDLVSSFGDSTVLPQLSPTDPAASARSFRDLNNRLAAGVDAALVDFAALRDSAPDNQVRFTLGRIVDEFTRAREAFTRADAALDVEEPTEENLQEGLRHFTEATRSLLLVNTILGTLELPAQYQAAAAVAPHCVD